jgi:predicted nucleic acid-binding protein
VDTSVILDVVQDEPVWAEWSQGQLDAWAARDELGINPVIYAELSIAYAHRRTGGHRGQRGAAPPGDPARRAVPGRQGFPRVPKAGGHQDDCPVGFLHGAHAAVMELPLLSRETTRYRTYFPSVTLIAPEV